MKQQIHRFVNSGQMAVHYFSLTDGSMEVHEDRIVIEDDFKKRQFALLAPLSFFLVMSFVNILRGFSKNSSDDKIMGLLYAALVFIVLLFRYKDLYPIRNDFSVKEVESIKFIWNRIGRDCEMILYLNNGRTRRVALWKDQYEISKLKNLLAAKGILISGG